MFEIPCVAIGGITPANAAPMVAAGADFLAVCQAVWGKDDPGEAVAAFSQGLDKSVLIMAACASMSIRTVAVACAISALAIPTPAMAAEANPCAALAGLVRQARNDFPSLKVKKFDAGTCTIRPR